MCVELCGNIVRSLKFLSMTACLCSGTDLGKETEREVDMGSRGLSACSLSSVSGEGANSGEGGDVPSSMLCKDTICGGLLCVLVVLMLLSLSLSSSLLVLLCLWLLLSAFS